MKWIPRPSICVRYCGSPFSVLSTRRQSWWVRQYSASARALASGTPWDQSVTGSLSGQRAVASFFLRSSSAACGTWTLNGVTSFVAAGSTICAAFMAVPCAVNDARLAGNIPAIPVAAAARMSLRREMMGARTPVLPSKSFFMSCSSCPLNPLASPDRSESLPSILINSLRRSAKLEHQDGASLRHVGLRPLNLVDAVLKASSVKVPARSDGDILLAVDRKRRGNTDGAGRKREAPQLVTSAGVKRSEQAIRSSTSEKNVSARNQKGRPEDRFEIVLPNSLAGI